MKVENLKHPFNILGNSDDFWRFFLFLGLFSFLERKKSLKKTREFVTEHSFFKIIYCKMTKIWHPKRNKNHKEKKNQCFAVI